MDMKTFKKTFKLICGSCGEFTHTDTQYCEKCGAEAIRTATKEDYEKHEKAASAKTKESRRVADGLRREDDKHKKDTDKIQKEKRKAERDADKAEWEAEREADKAKWEANRAEKKSE
ncbi:MAG: hypothetical protein ACFE9S_05510 [Candidatus Hermodarchaeota archaeon]